MNRIPNCFFVDPLCREVKIRRINLRSKTFSPKASCRNASGKQPPKGFPNYVSLITRRLNNHRCKIERFLIKMDRASTLTVKLKAFVIARAGRSHTFVTP